MEIEAEDGSKVLLEKGSNTEFGRGLGFPSDDRTISRRHISFRLDEGNQRDPYLGSKVRFEVIGKNPIWVFESKSGAIEVFRRFEGSEMLEGDKFCVSAKKPVWFTLNRKEDVVEGEGEGEVKRNERVLENQNDFAEKLLRADEDVGFEALDVSDVDPVKEFGFLVMGHEFDHYPKQVIRDMKNWNWFLENPRKDSDDEDTLEKKRKRGMWRKGKEDKHNVDDEDWTGESEDDKDLVAKLKQVQKPKYASTRSNDLNKLFKDTRSSRRSAQKKTIHTNADDYGDEEGDSLGGFVVSDDETEQEADDEDDEEEEEDFEEEEEEEEEDDDE